MKKSLKADCCDRNFESYGMPTHSRTNPIKWLTHVNRVIACKQTNLYLISFTHPEVHAVADTISQSRVDGFIKLKQDLESQLRGDLLSLEPQTDSANQIHSGSGSWSCLSPAELYWCFEFKQSPLITVWQSPVSRATLKAESNSNVSRELNCSVETFQFRFSSL